MTQEQIASELKTLLQGKEYNGSLTDYAANSIESGRSNYPVANLLTYCQDMNISLVMEDLTTEDMFYPTSILEVHSIIKALMERYQIECKHIYLKTEAHYTPPKSYDVQELEKLKLKDKRSVAPLSVNTFHAVCYVIHCDLHFEVK